MTVPMLKLADCITLTKGKPPAAMPYFGDDAEPYLSPEYLRGRGMAELAKPAANGLRVKDGDTILLWDGSNAGEVFRARAGLLASTMTHIRHGEEFEPEYFCYAAKRWEAYLKGQTSGSGIPHVDKEVFGKLEILKLPSYEQKLVAHILNKLDRAIEQTEALIAKQQRIKTGLMQDLLTKGIDEHGNIRSEATHAFKDSPLGRIPVEWEVAPMSAFQIPGRPFIKTGPFGSSLNTKHWVEDGVPVITIGSLGESGFLKKELLYVSDSTAQSLSASRVKPGDIVFSRVADIGRALVISAEQDAWIISSNFMRISLDQSIVRPPFLYRSIVFNPSTRDQLRVFSNSSGREVVNTATLSALRFAWPDPKEQDRINMRLNQIEESIGTETQVLSKFLSLKRGLMHDLLTGERRVTPLLAAETSQPDV